MNLDWFIESKLLNVTEDLFNLLTLFKFIWSVIV